MNANGRKWWPAAVLDSEFAFIGVDSRLQFGESWPEIFEEMNTSPNQPLEATGVSARDWPWSFGFAASVLAGASAGR